MKEIEDDADKKMKECKEEMEIQKNERIEMD